jgi:hypothetical protein
MGIFGDAKITPTLFGRVTHNHDDLRPLNAGRLGNLHLTFTIGKQYDLTELDK